MALIKVLIIFVVILALLNKRLPLYLAMIFGSLLMIVMFRLPLATAGQTALHTLTGWDVWSVNLAMYGSPCSSTSLTCAIGSRMHRGR